MATIMSQVAGARSARPTMRVPSEAPCGLSDLMAGQPVETFEPNRALFWENAPADHVFEILSGVVRLYRLMADGRRAITSFVYPGAFLGMSFAEAYAFGAEAVDTVRVRRLPRARLLESADKAPALRRELLARAVDELAAAQDQLLLLGRKTAEERVASFLIQTARRASSHGTFAKEIALPMMRGDIADYLGLTLETVSRIMSKLKADGLIALPTPNRAVLRDPAGLSAATGDDTDADLTPAVRRTVRQAAWPI